MDQRVICTGCNQPQSRKNISRHVRLCKKMVDLVNGPDEKSRSRSSREILAVADPFQFQRISSRV